MGWTVRRLMAIALPIGVGGLALACWLTTPSTQAPDLRVAALVGASTPRDRAIRFGHAQAAQSLAAEGLGVVEVVYLDPAGSAQTARDHLAGLEPRGISFVVDVADHDVAVGCGPLLRESKLVVLSSCSDPRLQGCCGQRFLRVAPWDGALVRALAEWARALQLRRPALLVPEGEAGRDLHEAFSRTWGGLGDGLVVRVRDGAAQAAWAAGRVTELAPDGLVCLVPVKDAVPLLTEVARAHAELRTLTLDPELAPALQGSPLVARLLLATPAEAETPVRQALVEAWKKENGGSEPDPALFAAHDALQLLLRAHRTAQGDLERTLLTLRSSDYRGATGRIAFTGDGERTVPAIERHTYTAQGVQVAWSRGP